MHVDRLADPISRAQLRALALVEQVAEIPVDRRVAIRRALDELNAALAELAATQDVLQAEADALAAADQSLVVEREHYEDLFELAPDAYLVTDSSGTIREANRAARALFNYPQPLLVGKRLALFVTAGDAVAFRLWFRALQPSAEPVAWEGQLQPCQGAAHDVAISVRAGREGSGRPSELLWVLHDVTERKRLEAEQVRLRQRAEATEERLRTLLDTLPDAIVITRGTGRIVFVNQEAEALFGYPRAELIGHEIELLVPERFRQGHREHRTGFAAAPRARPMGTGLELYGRRKDGSEFPVQIMLSPVGSGPDLLVTSVHRDITERKRAEQFLAAVLSSMGHEFRTPLTAVKTAVDVLLAEVQAEEHAEWRELLQTVDAATAQLTRLVSQSLALSRLEARLLHVEPDWQDLAELLGRATQQLDPARARVQLQVSDDLQAAYLDEMVVELIATNLLENALKYSPAESRVDVTAYRRDESVVIEVGDRGPGVAPDDAERIFEKFYRGAELPAGVAGSGLGLAIARGFAQAHGGDVRYAPRPGGGSIFTVTLPIAGPTHEVAGE